MKLFTKSFTIIALILLNVLISPLVVRSEDDILEDSEEDGVVGEDTPVSTEDVTATDEQTDESSEDTVGSSPYVTTHALFTQPESLEFPAGKLVRVVTSFRNNGSSSSYLVDSISASLRYPQDFQYHIQNFTTFEYNKVVENEREATFEYAFTPNEVFAGRPFGLVMTVNYRNNENRFFTNVLFNGTVNVVDVDEGLDGETVFLYIFLLAIVVLLGVIGHHYFSSSIRKRVSTKSTAQRSVSSNGGASSTEEVDFEWIPKEHLQTSKSPRTSPRQRKANGSNVAEAESN